jgi:rRNA maturation endonuclease Nob1
MGVGNDRVPARSPSSEDDPMSGAQAARVRLRCVDCRQIRTGTVGVTRRCDACGGELVPIVYRNRKMRRRGG